MLKFISFGSGSSGNCYFLYTEKEGLLKSLSNPETGETCVESLMVNGEELANNK